MFFFSNELLNKKLILNFYLRITMQICRTALSHTILSPKLLLSHNLHPLGRKSSKRNETTTVQRSLSLSLSLSLSPVRSFVLLKGVISADVGCIAFIARKWNTRNKRGWSASQRGANGDSFRLRKILRTRGNSGIKSQNKNYSHSDYYGSLTLMVNYAAILDRCAVEQKQAIYATIYLSLPDQPSIHASISRHLHTRSPFPLSVASSFSSSPPTPHHPSSFP